MIRARTRGRMAGILLGAAILLFSRAPLGAQIAPAPGTGPGLAETVEAIESARVTTRILYVTAHPDDENAAVLTYLARGLHADAALLSLTRGEGGQNALGPEQAPQLGLIRAQELLAATRGYGVKLFFTRAKDFGYSKTPEETMKVWDDQVLEDMVRVIRTFRPHVVINNWGGVHGGHGHHQAAGLLTPKAVRMAADPKAFSAQLQEGLHPWGDAQPVQILDFDRDSGNPKGYALPLDEISPLWGKSWREIGLDAFVNHRTQGIAGFLNSAFLRRPVALVPEGDGPLDPARLALPLSRLAEEFPAQREQIQKAERSLAIARDAALRLDWSASPKAIAEAGLAIAEARKSAAGGKDAAGDRQWRELEAVEERIQKALVLASGLEVRAEADRDELVAGETYTVTAQARCRAEAACAFGEMLIGYSGGMETEKVTGDEKQGFRFAVKVTSDAPILSAPAEWMFPEEAPLVQIRQDVLLHQYGFSVIVPAAHIRASSTRVDKVPPRIVPAYTLAIEPGQFVIAEGRPPKTLEALLRVHSYGRSAAKVTVGLDAPQGWQSSGPVEAEFSGEGDQLVRLSVTPPAQLPAGTYALRGYAKRGKESFRESLEPLASLPTRQWSEPAEAVVRVFPVNVPEGLRVGYISAESEPIPEAIGRLGIRVELLDAAAVMFSDLSRFDAVVVGVRAYELRPEVARANRRLLDYAAAGGTLVVQYERDFIWNSLKPAPYPATIGQPNPRITDENAPVRFLLAEHPLLNFPNKIVQEDFQGWVQERGLYFWKEFDPRYQAVLGMHDPGESELNGGLVYAPYGKGSYIYTGLAFFRQLPEGVPGAYRLFVNLLSQSKMSSTKH